MSPQWDGVEPERVWLVRALTQVMHSLQYEIDNRCGNPDHIAGDVIALEDIIAQVADTKEPIT